MIDYALIDKLHAQARRERSREVYRLLCRAGVWLLAFVRGENAPIRSAACCPNPA